jgi:hypothetical protein
MTWCVKIFLLTYILSITKMKFFILLRYMLTRMNFFHSDFFFFDKFQHGWLPNGMKSKQNVMITFFLSLFHSMIKTAVWNNFGLLFVIVEYTYYYYIEFFMINLIWISWGLRKYLENVEIFFSCDWIFFTTKFEY